MIPCVRLDSSADWVVYLRGQTDDGQTDEGAHRMDRRTDGQGWCAWCRCGSGWPTDVDGVAAGVDAIGGQEDEIGGNADGSDGRAGEGSRGRAGETSQTLNLIYEM